MVCRCLNCGSSAQLKLQTVIETDNKIVETYKCGCGSVVQRILKIESVTQITKGGVTK